MKNRRVFNPKVSIVIPVYNGSNYLREAIDSALNQTYSNIEIIVVNDGSNDNGSTELIALSYGDKIRYLSKENGGTSTALNLGIKNMSGDYFAWLSHDDLYHPENISSQIETLSQLVDKSTITMTDLNCMDSSYNITVESTNYKHHRDEYPPRHDSSIYPVMYMRLHGCQILFHKSVFETVGHFDENYRVAQDYEFFARAFRRFPHILIPRVLGTSRDSENRQGRTQVKKGNEEYSKVFLSLFKSLTDDEIDQMAPSKLAFIEDMRITWNYAGYSIALDSLNEIYFSSLQINYTDLPGRRFNGFDLHLALLDKGYKSKQVVWDKFSENESVKALRNLNKNDKYYNWISELENDYARRSTISPFFDDIFHSKEFLEADVVNLHIMHHPAFNINDLPILTRLKPTVWTIHDPWILSGHCVHHNDCNHWKTLCRDCPYLGELFSIDYDTTALQFIRKAIALSNSNFHIIVASDWMKQKIEMSPFLKDKKISVIPFGIDQDVFKPGDGSLIRAKYRIDDEIILLTRVDRSFKGTNVVIDAIRNLSSELKFTLITVGEKGLLPIFNDRVRHIDLGWVEDTSELVELYRSCTLFLMPSTKESFGVMAVEAMSCGKVVVALDAPNSALSQTINSPVCGISVMETSLAKTIKELILDNDRRTLLEGNSLKYAKEVYSLENYVKRTLELYREAIDNFKIEPVMNEVLGQLKKNGPYFRRPGGDVVNLHSTPEVGTLDLEISSMVRASRYIQAFGYRAFVRSALRKFFEYRRSYGNVSTFKKILDLLKGFATKR